MLLNPKYKMIREFDHDKYGFRVSDVFTKQEECEPRCTIVLCLGAALQDEGEVREITRCIPLADSILLMRELRHSCDFCICKMQELSARYKASDNRE